MKYKLEIISNNIHELIEQTRDTFFSLSSDIKFVRRIESKGMESIFFTEHANIIIIDEDKELREGGEE